MANNRMGPLIAGIGAAQRQRQHAMAMTSVISKRSWICSTIKFHAKKISPSGSPTRQLLTVCYVIKNNLLIHAEKKRFGNNVYYISLSRKLNVSNISFDDNLLLGRDYSIQVYMRSQDIKESHFC
jgi:hypothetical protein